MSTVVAVRKPDQPLSTLPSGFDNAPLQGSAGSKCTTPYVTFAHRLKTNYGEMAAAIKDLRDGDPVIIPPGGKPQKIPVLKYFLIRYHQFWGQYDSDGKITAYSAEEQPRGSDWQETIETVSIVFVNDQFLSPVTMQFKGAKCPGVKPAIKALRIASTPEWLEKSDHHAATGNIEAAWARFTATTKRGTERPGKRGTYVPLESAVITPTTFEPKGGEYKLLRAFFSNEDFKKVYAEVVKNFEQRVETAKA